jgi:hypothetical protein
MHPYLKCGDENGMFTYKLPAKSHVALETLTIDTPITGRCRLVRPQVMGDRMDVRCVVGSVCGPFYSTMPALAQMY